LYENEDEDDKANIAHRYFDTIDIYHDVICGSPLELIKIFSVLRNYFLYSTVLDANCIFSKERAAFIRGAILF
jgi:hypothetical protein